VVLSNSTCKNWLVEKQSSHCSCFAQILLISSQSHTSHLTLLFLRNSNQHEIEPTEQRNPNMHVYDSRSNKKPKKSKNKTGMIILLVASKSIRNINEIENLNKNRNKICKTMKRHPNMLDMLKLYCKKREQ